MMQLELFPNELLLELFEFLDGIYLVRAFYGLNSRFNELLLLHYRNFHFNFEDVPKEDFDIICQKHLPLIIDRIISIQISGDLETPQLPELFLYYGFTLNRFMHLKSLSLCSISSLYTLMKITFQCRYFPNLTHFNMIDCYIGEFSKDGMDLLNNIWRLPKLTHCNFDGIREIENYLLEISIVSSSIENLSIENCNLYSLVHLLEYTPNLRRLATTFRQFDEYSHLKTIVSSLTSLEISFSGCDTSLIYIFQSLPKLRHLTLETSLITWNGYKWQEVLDRYFPHLKVFRFKINNYSLRQEEDVDKLLDSFRTPFWLEKHQWFVGCQWNPRNVFEQANLYTLPYAFGTIPYPNGRSFKSTCFDEENYYSYERVQYLFVYPFEKSSFPDDFHIRFPNICELRIDLPFNPITFSCFLLLNRLRSLHVSIKEDGHYHHLQDILNQLPCLYSLHLKIACDSHRELFQLTSSSVRRLDLLPFRYSPCFTIKDCINLISSPLGLQCEVLAIYVDNRMNVLNLIQKMSNLRSLRFICKDDKSYYRESNDELRYWLQNHLPSTCSFNECRQNSPNFDVWINRQTKNITRPSKVQKKDSSRLRSFKHYFKKLRD